jgi:hypothetical protein
MKIQDQLLELLPAMKHMPASFDDSWHCKPGSVYRIRNLIAKQLPKSNHDCWTLEPMPKDVNESEWTTITIDSEGEGGALFVKGEVITRFISEDASSERPAIFFERSTSADHEGMENDLYPAKIQKTCTRRYLSDGSRTVIRHASK